ncbi:hypothetical protein [Clostridium sp. DJ247]|nr:hypothetical protein [Clostridium sp. DJ247]MBC2581875.1 hypothetical protein [Clostridium sp. DJ247]
MAKRKDEQVKVVIMNPERLQAAKEKLMKVLYEEYIRETSKDDLKGIAQ